MSKGKQKIEKMLPRGGEITLMEFVDLLPTFDQVAVKYYNLASKNKTCYLDINDYVKNNYKKIIVNKDKDLDIKVLTL